MVAQWRVVKCGRRKSRRVWRQWLTLRKPSQVSALYKRTIALEDARLKAEDPKAGLRFVPLKQLRHSHATRVLASGVDAVTVSRRLGHSTVSITDAFYLRPGRARTRRPRRPSTACGIARAAPSVRGHQRAATARSIPGWTGNTAPSNGLAEVEK